MEKPMGTKWNDVFLRSHLNIRDIEINCQVKILISGDFHQGNLRLTGVFFRQCTRFQKKQTG